MDDIFKTTNNQIVVKYKPIMEDVDNFIGLYVNLLAWNDEKSTYVTIEDHIDMISTYFIGALINCAMLAHHAGKVFYLRCNKAIMKIIKILDVNNISRMVMIDNTRIGDP